MFFDTKYHSMLLSFFWNVSRAYYTVQAKIKAMEQDLRDLDCKKGSVACLCSRI